MRLSVSVMAHPSRRNLVARLLPKLGNPPVAWDERSDRWHTGKRALKAHDPRTDYHCVVQDDAILPPMFVQGVRNALANIPPDSPLVLYCTRTKQWAPVLDRVPRDASYLVMDYVYWGVAVAVPTYMIPEMVDWCDQLTTPHYDHRLGEWFRHLGVPCYYTFPNLADHSHVPSLIAGRSARRSAYRFVRGRADRVRWDGPTVSVEPPADLKWPRLNA